MTRPDLSAIRARLEGANEEWRRTDGPTKADFGIAGALGLKQRIYNVYLDSAAAVVLADRAPTDLAALLEYVGELEGQVERAGLAACQHRFEADHGMYDSTHRYCTICGRAE